MCDGGRDEVLQPLDVPGRFNDERHGIAYLTNQQNLILKSRLALRASPDNAADLVLGPALWLFADMAEHQSLLPALANSRFI
jgi:hypothetical protein